MLFFGRKACFFSSLSMKGLNSSYNNNYYVTLTMLVKERHIIDLTEVPQVPEIREKRGFFQSKLGQYLFNKKQWTTFPTFKKWFKLDEESKQYRERLKMIKEKALYAGLLDKEKSATRFAQTFWILTDMLVKLEKKVNNTKISEAERTKAAKEVLNTKGTILVAAKLMPAHFFANFQFIYSSAAVNRNITKEMVKAIKPIFKDFVEQIFYERYKKKASKWLAKFANKLYMDLIADEKQRNIAISLFDDLDANIINEMLKFKNEWKSSSAEYFLKLWKTRKDLEEKSMAQ